MTRDLSISKIKKKNEFKAQRALSGILEKIVIPAQAGIQRIFIVQ